MPTVVEQAPQVQGIDARLLGMGLSRGAVDNLHIAADFLQDHWWAAALLGGGSAWRCRQYATS